MLKYHENCNEKSKFDEYYMMDLNVVIGELNKENLYTFTNESKEHLATEKWIQKYGLEKNKLKWENILDKIGFKRSEEYIGFLKKPVCSRYSGNIFLEEFCPENGKTYHITKSTEKLVELKEKINYFKNLYFQRLNWLNCGSRRIFGLIVEQSITIVFDIYTHEKLNLYTTVAIDLIKTQIKNIKKFNFIWVKQFPIPFSRKVVETTDENLAKAVQWLKEMRPKLEKDINYTYEAIKLAVSDKSSEAIYLFSEGDSSQGCADAIQNIKEEFTLNVVLFDSLNYDSINELKGLSDSKNGRFHAYGINIQFDMYDLRDWGIAKIKKAFGGMPHGIKAREDVFQIFMEYEEIDDVLHKLGKIIEKLNFQKHKPTEQKEDILKDKLTPKYMSSENWLNKNGLVTRKLCLLAVLSNVAFKHCNGLVSTHEKTKLIDARYCEKFAHVLWKDGEIMHVYVTPDVCRDYCNKVKIVQNLVIKRLNLLKQTSIYYFGRIFEKKAYFLIDISLSMKNNFKHVQEIFYKFLNEQFVDLKYFNIIAFNNKFYTFSDNFVFAEKSSINSALNWLRNQTIGGSTDFIPPLLHVLDDMTTDCIFIFSDGRPNENFEEIYFFQNQRNMRMNTLSFNSVDIQANDFLRNLAVKSGGTYSVHIGAGENKLLNIYNDEDTLLLEHEKRKCRENIKVMTKLKDECCYNHGKKRNIIHIKWNRSNINEFYNNDDHKGVPLDILRSINAHHEQDCQKYSQNKEGNIQLNKNLKFDSKNYVSTDDKTESSKFPEEFQTDKELNNTEAKEAEGIISWLRNNSLKSKNLLLSDLLPESERTISCSKILSCSKVNNEKLKLYKHLLCNFIRNYEEFLNNLLTRILKRDVKLWFKEENCDYSDTYRHKLMFLVEKNFPGLYEAIIAVLDEYDLACYYKSRLD